MDDKAIIHLFFERSEAAIKETTKKYGAYCYAIAYRILENHEDSEECVNDSYLALWSSIPPNRPHSLSAYIAKTVRNISLNRQKAKRAQKRGGGEIDAVLEEVEHILSDSDDILNDIVLKDTIERFLKGLKKRQRIIFMQRYWYMASVEDIANEFSISEANVKMILSRTRNELRDFLKKEDITV